MSIDVHERVERFLSSPFVPDFAKHEFMRMLERLAQLRPVTLRHDPDASLTSAFIVDRIEEITDSLLRVQQAVDHWRGMIEPEIADCDKAPGRLLHFMCRHDTLPAFLGPDPDVARLHLRTETGWKTFVPEDDET